MFAVLAYPLVAVALQASPRTWTDYRGRTTTAEFVRVYQGNVILLRGNRVLKVPLNNLSRQDQQYVNERLVAPQFRTADRGHSVSPPTIPEPSQRPSRPMVEMPVPPRLADFPHVDSESPAKRWSNPSPKLPPNPASRRVGVISRPPTATPPQHPKFGRLTVEEANSLIVEQLFKETGSRDPPRRKSFSATDWPDTKQLARVEQDKVPILGAPNLTASRLDVRGVASAGEVFALVEQKNVFALVNPLGNAPDQSGTWYMVQMLDGKQGWLFAEPQGHQGCPIARLLAAEGMSPPTSNAAHSPASPQLDDSHPQTRRPTPSLGDIFLKPLSDPQLNTAQRVGRGIGMVLGGVLAVVVLIGTFVALLLTAGGGWRWRWWRERLRWVTQASLFSRLRRGGQPSSQTT